MKPLLLTAADPIGSHAPSSTDMPGGSAVNTIINWTMYGALVCCLLGLICAGAMIATGNLSARPHMAERGKVAVIWSLGGAVLIGLAVALVNQFYGLSSP